MAEIRACTGGDIPGVAKLFLTAFKKGEANSVPVLSAYLTRLYFENPWYDPDMPSLVADAGGDVCGFIGVLPLPLRLEGRPVRAAVGGNLMVHPEAHDPMLAVRLLRRYFAGPQELAFTDTANVAAVKLWSGFGGVVSRFHTMRWLLPLRAGSLAVAAARRSPRGAKIAWLGKPVAWPIDRLSLRRLRVPSHDGAELHDVPPEQVRGFMQAVGDRRYLHLDVDEGGFGWLVEMCRLKTQFGPLKIMALPDPQGRDAGVVMYYPNRGGLGQVVLLLAREGAHGALLDALVRDATREGTAALMGQADPRLMSELGDRVSLYVQRNEFVTLRSGDPSVAARIACGDVSVNRLCGEWWTRMQGDTF